MDLKINDAVVAAFKDKDSRVERFRSLYEQHDFLTAYAKHTDLRVLDNPKGAIGREDEWESHGKLQLQFLISEGLKPFHRLLDVGCGVGRGARKFVPYLDPGNYCGIDISEGALAHAQQLAVSEGWVSKEPTFMINSDMDLDRQFDYIWAHSVLTHIPPQQITVMFSNATKLLNVGSRFVFTFKERNKPTRTGLKQFGYDVPYLAALAKPFGFSTELLTMQFPAGQKTIRLTRV